MITKLTNYEKQRIEARVLEEVEKIAEGWGLGGFIKSSASNSNTLQIKIEFNVADSTSGKALSTSEQNFRNMAFAWGMKADDFGTTFRTLTGEVYRITGANPRRRKYPISAERIRDCKNYKFSVANVVGCLALSKPVA